VKKVLVAIELSDDVAHFVIGKALDVCGPQAQLEVVHVVDPASVTYSVDPTMTGQMYQQMFEQVMSTSKRRLAEICAPFAISTDRQHVRYGRVAHEVHALLTEGEFDACMVGSHGYAGWRRLLGSKANAILHGTPVDTWVFSLAQMQVESTSEDG
jgi:universal stress protein A